MATALESINSFFANYEHLMSGVSAIATALAVIVSLSIARSAQNAHRSRLKATFTAFMSNKAVINPITAFNINIINIGQSTSFIGPYGLTAVRLFPFRTEHFDIVGFDALGDLNKQNVTISPNSAYSRNLDLGLFSDEFKPIFLKRKYDRHFLPFIFFFVVALDQRAFLVKLDKDAKLALKILAAEDELIAEFGSDDPPNL